jgi:hypothetical protein
VRNYIKIIEVSRTSTRSSDANCVLQASVTRCQTDPFCFLPINWRFMVLALMYKEHKSVWEVVANMGWSTF